MEPTAGAQANQEIEKPSAASESVVVEWQNDQGWRVQTDATVLRRGARSMVVGADAAPPDGSLVSIRDGQSFYRATVRAHRGVGVRSHVELQYTEDGRRREGRMAAGGEAKVSWDSGGRSRESLGAEVLNVSDGGLQLLSKVEVPVGVYIQIVGEATERVGKIRYCRSTLDGYLMGVEFVRSPLG